MQVIFLHWFHHTTVLLYCWHAYSKGPSSPPLSTLEYPFVWRKGVLNGYSRTRVSLWDSLMFGRVLEY